MSSPSFQTDFLDAMERHWLDAELLNAKACLANADQLYGLVAECGLKALMLKWGMPFLNDKPTDRADQKHANGIWDRYETYRQGQPATFALPATNPFQSWRIEHRYANRADFSTARLQQHQAGA
ncbi:hypothetical protein [Synechococcus sp. CS-1328]|uniref:hypothetical protein n=1 Tax=Synechococcus sp. CS-1328 TaxID=2847976 RepID=UPI00223A9947|nr:hypothetical protein [Synechococcus sp. CS-1328]MCT0223856.1 hypothetical protein [Synechococcus sp. CS-1328]